MVPTCRSVPARLSAPLGGGCSLLLLALRSLTSAFLLLRSRLGGLSAPLLQFPPPPSCLLSPTRSLSALVSLPILSPSGSAAALRSLLCSLPPASPLFPGTLPPWCFFRPLVTPSSCALWGLLLSPLPRSPLGLSSLPLLFSFVSPLVFELPRPVSPSGVVVVCPPCVHLPPLFCSSLILSALFPVHFPSPGATPFPRASQAWAVILRGSGLASLSVSLWCFGPAPPALSRLSNLIFVVVNDWCRVWWRRSRRLVGPPFPAGFPLFCPQGPSCFFFVGGP